MKVRGNRIDMFRFADDTAIMTERSQNQQKILAAIDRLMEEKFNVKINRREKPWVVVEKLLASYETDSLEREEKSSANLMWAVVL